ncbi:sigma-70 family RNA polymerase sigma factor [Haloferula sp. A504]|uniref:sigma-70 family RNA polymerase sigma factor n=1 Tax=Haloferula sp. A504 TaxID=3373601 RepID=UPI0031CB4AA6|nr:sigma-70 family RNA polymerase sigma factor [Verrucomicrobiaceae bacterium E54]
MAQLTSHQAELLAYVHSLMPGDPSVKDVVQRTNVVVWKKRSKFKEGTNFRSWIFAIARLEVRAHHKERKRKSWLVVDDELADRITATMIESSDAQPIDELRIALEACMRRLKPTEKELIDHRYYSDQTLEDYARSQDRTVGSLKVSLFRIRATLKRCIESQITTGPTSAH